MNAELSFLPPLRQDLQLQRANADSNGQAQWTLYDPLSHFYHALNKKTLTIIQHWQAGDIDVVREKASKSLSADVSEDDIRTVLQFLHQHFLVDTPRGGDSNAFVESHFQKKRLNGRQLMHSYVFFRIPLLKPQILLDRLAPFISFCFSRTFWIGLAVLACLAIGLVARQWDQFISTFFGFLSAEGFLGYALAIIVTKIAHEFGHAFAAHRYGCRVTSMGIGFMLMFPILYADTTDAWRLKSRRKRLVIGASGMGAELIIAVIATLLWNILPDGSLRAITFFLATTSWVLTVFVNLNPLMRFDGYYLLADFLDFKNLQPRSNALARWWLRETLFKTSVPCPETLPKSLHNGLIIYALAVWIYRFFLFLGIALMLHAFIIKAVAIVLAIVEIGWFIVRPILMEIREWPSLFHNGHGNRRLISLGLFSFIACMFFLPWQGVVKAPAVLKPSEEATLFAGLPGKIEEIHISPGQRVIKGMPLLTLDSPALRTQMALSEETINILQIRINRQAVDAVDRAERSILLRELAGEIEKLKGYEQLQQDMVLRAPMDGHIHGMSHDLHVGRWVSATLPIMNIRGNKPAITTAFVSEDDVTRIHPGATASFIADHALLQPTPVSVKAIAPAGSQVLEIPILSSTYGGGIATRENQDGNIVPVRGIFEIALETKHFVDRDIRGIVRIKAERRSPASALWRRFIAIINRETGAS